MRALTADNADQQRRIPTLEKIAAERITRGEMVIGLRRDQGLEAAAYDIRNGPSQRTSDEFQATVREMEDEELRLMVSRKAEAEQRFNQSKVAVIFGTILGLLITAAAAWSVWRDGSRRGQAEEALQDSQERYRMLLDEVRDHAIVMMDPQGKIVTWNAGAQQIQGYSADQIIGQDFSCFYLPEDIARGRPQDILRRTAASGRLEEHGMRVRKDGSRFLASVVFTALHDQAGNLRGFSAICRDLTESKEFEVKYRGLLEAAPDAMVVVNQGEEIVLLNLQAEKEFGYHRDELLGQKVTNIIPAGFAERLIADDLRSMEDALAQQIGGGIELTGRRKDGSEFPIEIMLSPLKSAEGTLVTAAIRDISVRKAAEKVLAQMEGRYRGLLEAAPDAMVVVHQDGGIVLLNLPGREGVRLPPRRAPWAEGDEHHSCGLRGTAGRGRSSIQGRRDGTADRRRDRADGTTQGRQRVSDRDHAEPAEECGGNAGDGGDPRHQRAQACGEVSGADGGPVSRAAGGGTGCDGGGEPIRRDRAVESFRRKRSSATAATSCSGRR